MRPSKHHQTLGGSHMVCFKANNSLPAVNKFINGIINRKITDLAKRTGFTKRNDGKLLPCTFVKSMTIDILNISNPTLKNIAYSCESIQGSLSIRKEAIYQKLKAGSQLLKEVLKESLKYAVNSSAKACGIGILEQFNDVYICDSTVLTVPKKLEKEYPGSGGKLKKGELKIQTVYSLVDRSIKSVEVIPGHANDCPYVKELAKKVNPGDLVMFDLGYRDNAGYKDIISKGAFFLTRVMNNSRFHKHIRGRSPATNKLDMVDILKKSKNNIVDMELAVGTLPNTRIQCRFIAIRLPDAVVNERIRKTCIKRRKTSLSKKDLELLKWNTFITNAPAEKLPVESVCSLYRQRWQIELLFKACKSYLKLGNLGIGGKHQLECILYGRLINAIFLSVIYSHCYFAMFTTYQREVSTLKFFDYLGLA